MMNELKFEEFYTFIGKKPEKANVEIQTEEKQVKEAVSQTVTELAEHA